MDQSYTKALLAGDVRRAAESLASCGRGLFDAGMRTLADDALELEVDLLKFHHKLLEALSDPMAIAEERRRARETQQSLPF